MIHKFCGLLAAQLLGLWSTTYGQDRPDSLRYADWQLYWANEFNVAGDSSTVAPQWQFSYPWGRNLGGYEAQYYSGQQVDVDTAGTLHLRARRRETPRPYRLANGTLRQLNYESSMLFSRFRNDSLSLPRCPGGRTGFTYGLFEIRCRLPRTQVSFPAFWLYGDPDEVDIFEGGSPEAITNNVILWRHPFWRLGQQDLVNEASQSIYYWPGPGRLTDEFHRFALNWQPGELVYYFDGIPIRRETRLLPLGCPLDIIANLCMQTWAIASATSFDIDYIRVYRLRKPVPTPPLALIPPVVGCLRVPNSPESVANAAQAEMLWHYQEQPNQRPRLEAWDNHNPRDFNTLALPSRGRWLTPMVAFNQADSPRHWVVSPDSTRSALSWTLYDVYGQPVRHGRQLPAAQWELNWPDLPPGAYRLQLRTGEREVCQPVYQLGRPESSEFTPAWQTVPTAEATK